MRSLGQAVRRTTTPNAELPLPWPSLARSYQVAFRRCQASILAAAPGGGKSIIALAFAIQSRAPTLFVSADTDLITMAVRAGAMMLGWSQANVQKALTTSQVQRALDNINHIRWCDEAQPTVRDIYDEVKAYAEVHGDFPALIVVDNLIDVRAERTSEKDWTNARTVVDRLKQLARESGAHVMILAHATGGFEDGRTPIPLSGLEFKPGKNVELVLTMYWGDGQELRVCPVKNRSGVSSARAGLHTTLYADLGYCSIHDPANGQWLLGVKAA
jgi:predicted ATP-dependent serine protease